MSMSNLEVARLRETEAVAAFEAGDFAEAARRFAWAYDQYAKVAHAEGRLNTCPKVEEMFFRGGDAQRRRDEAQAFA